MEENERLTQIETRLDAAEKDLIALRKNVHDIKNEQQIMVGQIQDLQNDVTTVKENTDKLVVFFEGTDRVFGFCRKHWRTMLKFGCGFVTAYGVTNPAVQRTLAFTIKFFGL